MTESSGKVPAQEPQGPGMVDSVRIKNFRGFRDLEVKGLAPINLIVGDNGVGKTAFLEALGLVLSGSTSRQFAYKNFRGIEQRLSLTDRSDAFGEVVEDLFGPEGVEKPAHIETTSYSKPERKWESRSLTIQKTSSDVVLPVTSAPEDDDTGESGFAIPADFTWLDSDKKPHKAYIRVTAKNVSFGGTNEGIPKVHFVSNYPVGSRELADVFSELRDSNRHEEFLAHLKSVYESIQDAYVRSHGGRSSLMARVSGSERPLNMAMVSGGTARVTAILMLISRFKNGLVMVDEIENGVFHTRIPDFCRAMLKIARAQKTQLFLTTHSLEWLSLFFAETKDNLSDVAFWRMERSAEGVTTVERTTGATLAKSVKVGDVR